MSTSSESNYSNNAVSSSSPSSVFLVNSQDAIENESSISSGDNVGDIMPVDFSEYFTTDLIWATMGELREWVRTVGYGLNMVITTKKSDAEKSIILHCEESGVYRTGKKMEGQCKPTSNRVGYPSKKDGCPFLLRGIFTRGRGNISPGWRLRVETAYHNHELPDDLDGHSFVSRLTPEQKQKIAKVSACGTRPKKIVTQLTEEYPDREVTNTQVYKCRAMQRIKNLGNLSVIDYSVKFLKDKGYFTDILTEKDDEGNHTMTDFFISHPTARRLLKMFPNVVIMDATYKTNRYGMPLLEFVGFTSTSKTYCIALVFMKRETIEHYEWALRRLQWLFEEKRPICFMSDRDLATLTAVENVFGDVHHMLCQVHIDRNVRAWAKNMGINPTHFCSSVRRVMRSHSVEEYRTRLTYFRNKWNSRNGGLVKYVESTWLTPHKKKLVCAWCDDILHFGTRTSNRVESQHSMLKDMLGSSVGGLDTIVQHIDNMYVYQLKVIKREMRKSGYMVTIDITEGPKWIRKFFKNLVRKVSSVCLRLLLVQVHKAKNSEASNVEDPRDRWLSGTMGLPSPTKIKIYLDARVPLPLSEIDIFWQQIKWEGLDHNDDHEDDPGVQRFGQEEMDNFVKAYASGEVPEDLLCQMTHALLKGKEQEEDGVGPPTQGEVKKGRPRMNARKTGTKRDNTWEEHVDAKAKKLGKERKKASMGHGSQPQMDSQDQEECIFVREVVPPPRAIPPSSTHLGFNWASENVDTFMLQYIYHVIDVTGDGHCGYRSLSVLVGRGEGMYPSMRQELSEFIKLSPGYWQMVFEDERPINELIRQVSWMGTPCSSEYWMPVPIMGLIFATLYQVAVVVLSWFGPCTCLPLYAPVGTEPPTFVLAIALVGNHNHFVPIWLNDCCPIPPPPRQWTVYKDPSVTGYDFHPRFSRRFEAFMRFRMASGRPSIIT